MTAFAAANIKLTFHLDHSTGADQVLASLTWTTRRFAARGKFLSPPWVGVVSGRCARSSNGLGPSPPACLAQSPMCLGATELIGLVETIAVTHGRLIRVSSALLTALIILYGGRVSLPSMTWIATHSLFYRDLTPAEKGRQAPTAA